MRSCLLCCYVCCVLAGCSVTQVIPTLDGDSKDNRNGQLLNIRVERWHTLRFSGLLGLREDSAGLYYVLLDATGVKLLEAELARDVDHNLLRVSGALKESEFAPFLSEALARIYFVEPTELPCSGSWFYTVCRETITDGGWRKYGQAGPFTVWQISAERKDGAEDDDSVVYRHPWLGVSISLKPIASGK